MSAPDPIWILDEIELRPGKLAAFRAALEADYLPGARERGMELVHQLATPPVELAEGGTRLLLDWRLPGLADFWAMRAQNTRPGVADFWRDTASLYVARTRRHAADVDALERLDGAARANA